MTDRSKFLFSLKLVGIQFFLVFACAYFRFFNLTHWDGEWYRQIVEVGYNAVHSADPFAEGKGNVGFFPGYPLAVYIVKKILGFGTDRFPTTGALLLVSNGFAVLTWYFLQKWIELIDPIEQKPAVQKAKLFLLAFYPFIFFLYCAYTESLFISMTLGFIYFSEKVIREDDQKKSFRFLLLALVCGFEMNLTRLLGIVMVAYPILRALQTREKIKRSLLLAAGTLLSPVSFFFYCWLKFGAWDFYFQTELAIWGTYIDIGRLFPPKTLFDFHRPLYSNTMGKYVTILTGFFLTAKLIELLKQKLWLEPFFAIVLVCGMMWGEYLLGRTSWDYVGMGRYLIPVFALILPFLKIEPKFNWKWAAFSVLMIGFQIAYALKFGRHGWVA